MPDPTRSYELTFDERPRYLYVHVKADAIDADIAMAYLREVVTHCSRIKCKRIVIHRDIPNALDEGSQFFIARDFHEMTAGIKTAFVNTYLSNEAALKFAVTVGRNRGADFALFNNDADAEKWLLR
jgi:hypothetical protein